MKNYAIVLAAGKGTRMKSSHPKVLHPVCGVPMLQHIINTLKKTNIDEIIVVVGHQADDVKKAIKDDVTFVEQLVQLGTAHAVSQAIPYLKDLKGQTLIVSGDTPLIELETLNTLLQQQVYTESHGTVLTTVQSNPTGYGRIVRNSHSLIEGSSQEDLGDFVAIVEEKDASPDIQEIVEINTGVFAFQTSSLVEGLPLIDNKNNQNEYYLTDIVTVFLDQGKIFEGVLLDVAEETMGINSRVQLAEAEAVMRKRINEMHMNNGVTLIDPSNTYIGKNVYIERDTTIYPGVCITGNTAIGSNVTIYSNCDIKDTIIENDVVIRQSVLHQRNIEAGTIIGPL